MRKLAIPVDSSLSDESSGIHAVLAGESAKEKHTKSSGKGSTEQRWAVTPTDYLVSKAGMPKALENLKRVQDSRPLKPPVRKRRGS